MSDVKGLQPVEETAKSLAREDALRQDEAGRPGKLGAKSRTASRLVRLGIPVAVVVVVLCGAIYLILGGGGQSSRAGIGQPEPTQASTVAAAPTATATETPTSSPTQTPTTSPTDTPTPSPTNTATAVPVETATAIPTATFSPTAATIPVEPTTVVLSGQYNLSLSVKSDPAGHTPFVGMPPVLLGNVEFGSIIISAPAPWVKVSGPLNGDGSFRATGTGVVAGRSGIGVEFVGELSVSGLSGDYAMGVASVGGALPNQPIVFSVNGQRLAAASPTPAAVAKVQAFARDLSQASRTNDKAFLLQRLHPVAIGVYGKDKCQLYFDQRAADPTRNIQVLSVQGRGTWTYATELQSVPVKDVYSVEANVTQLGKTAKTTIHFGEVDNQLYWFTMCTVKE